MPSCCATGCQPPNTSTPAARTTPLSGSASVAVALTGLELALPKKGEHPSRIHEAMRYAIFGGGKRLRAALCRLLGT